MKRILTIPLLALILIGLVISAAVAQEQQVIQVYKSPG